MTSIEMSLARQVIANAFGILLLLVVSDWLLHLTVQCVRQHWRIRKLQFAFEESKDPQRLLRRTPFKASPKRPASAFAGKNPRCGRADATFPVELNPQHPRIRSGSGCC